MEKQIAKFKAFSRKTGGVCLDLGDGEEWFNATERVLDYLPKVSKDADVSVVVDEDKNLSFIQNNDSQNNESNGNGIEKMSALKNYQLIPNLKI